MTAVLVLTAVVGAAVAVQVVTGSGFGVLAGPALLLLSPATSTTSLLVVTLPVMLVTAWPARRRWREVETVPAAVGGCAGTAAGVLLLHAVPQRTTDLVVGVAILAAVACTACGLSVRTTGRSMVVAGTLGGGLGALAAAPGPPLVLVYRQADPVLHRAGLGVYFLVVCSAALAAAGLAGADVRHEALDAVPMLPGVALGALAGPWLRRRTGPRAVRRAVLVLTAASGAGLCLRALAG